MVICTGPETQQDLEFGQPGWTNLCNVWQLSDFSSSHRVLQIPVVYHLPHQADHVRLHVSTNPFDAWQKKMIQLFVGCSLAPSIRLEYT